MADKIRQIKEFPPKTDFGDDDLLLIQGQNTTYNVKGSAVKAYAENAAKPQVDLARAEAQAAAAAADRAETAIQHPAVPDPATGNWKVWDQVSESYQETVPPIRAEGQDFEIKGYYPTLEALEAAVSAPDKGYAYGVGTQAPYDIYVWDAVHSVWVNNGPMTASGDMLKSIYDPQHKEQDIFLYAESVGLPAGGAAGQIPVKKTVEDYDVEWQDPSEIGVTSFKGRTGDVKPATGDYSVSQITGAAPKNNPVLTGAISHGRKADSTVGFYSLASGRDVIASGPSSSALGENTSALGKNCHAEGYKTVAGDSEGSYYTAGSHAEGYMSKAGTADPSSNYIYGAHAEGYDTTADGNGAHAEGWLTIANGNGAHAEGYRSEAKKNFTHAGGYITIAAALYQTAIGSYNIESSNLLDLLIVGNGSASARSNCFRVNSNGVYAKGSYSASGADYAELFEWADGNPDAADRVGRFVTLEGKNIRLAGPGDDYLLGIVSGAPSVIGDVYDDQWQGIYLTDIFGRPLWEDVEVPEEIEEVRIPIEAQEPDGSTSTIGYNVERRTVIPAHTERRQKLNPAYDNTQPYIPRSERPEWAVVGMLGKLVAVDDGTCQANGWAAAGEGGAATASTDRTCFRVMERLDESHVRILILR